MLSIPLPMPSARRTAYLGWASGTRRVQLWPRREAKLTGRLGVCAGTAGPGATHLLAGLYDARHDHAPVLAIAGDVPTSMDGIDYLQVADHAQSFRDACVYAASVTSADGAAAQIHEEIPRQRTARRRASQHPAECLWSEDIQTLFELATLRQPPEISPAGTDLDAAAELIDQAKSIVLFVGYGAHPAKAEVVA
jgi:pyruvate dehydrogenase (quinone)